MAVARRPAKADISLALGSGQIMCSLQCFCHPLTGKRHRIRFRATGASRRQAMKAALLTILILLLAMPVLAQQAPPTWQQGRTPDQASSPLAPHAQPPAPKAASEIPVNTIKVPAGFKVELWASGIDNARAMTWGDKGTLFVSSRGAGNVYAVVDQNGRREVKTIAKGLQMPNGVAFKDGALYVAEISRITKYEGIENNLDSVPQPKVVIDTLPKDLPHGWKYLSFGPDGKLYFNIGAPCNICMPPRPTPRSSGSMPTAPDSSTSPGAFATASVTTSIR